MLVKPRNINSSLVYSWLTTSSSRFPFGSRGSVVNQSLL